MIIPQALLFIEPTQAASPKPVIDEFTRKMCASFRRAKRSSYSYGGIHECICGAKSSSSDYCLENQEITNSLCVHYLAHHRSEVPPEQLARVKALRFEEENPNEGELQGPEPFLASIRISVREKLGSARLDTWVAWGLDTDSLHRSLLGGCISKSPGFTEARQEADALLEVIRSINFKVLPRLREAIENTHGSVLSWGAEALRLPGWKRGLWPIPLVEIMGNPNIDSFDRREMANAFKYLGVNGGMAIPVLFELAKKANGALANDLCSAYEGILRTTGLLIPPDSVPGLLELARESTPYPGLRLASALALARAGINTEYAVQALFKDALENHDGLDFEYEVAVLDGTVDNCDGFGHEPGIQGWGPIAVPILIEALDSSDRRVRRWAIRFLGHIGADAKVAVPALKKAGEDLFLRTRVEETVIRILSPESADKDIAEKREFEREKAQVLIPPIDPAKPRHTQFFRFKCPFCSHAEVVGLWYPSKLCPHCLKSILIVEKPGYSGCELIDSASAVPEPQ